MTQGTVRRRRRAGRDDELAATARRRVTELLRPASGGWVPAAPADAPPRRRGAPPVQDPRDRLGEGGRNHARRRASHRVARLASHRAAVSDRVPAGMRAALVAPAGRAVAGLLLLVLLAVAAAVATTWLARPDERPVPARGRTIGAPLTTPTAAVTPQSGATTSPSGLVVVHVTGEVRDPGVVQLPAGSRVEDAVEAAGGATRRARTASVNLARQLVDGEQVVVLGRGDPPQPVVGAGPSAAVGPAPGGAGMPVNLNTATLDQLDGLPGIGPVLAQRILDWRTTNGRFSVVDELGEVSGIGEATLADLRPLVTV